MATRESCRTMEEENASCEKRLIIPELLIDIVGLLHLSMVELLRREETLFQILPFK